MRTRKKAMTFRFEDETASLIKSLAISMRKTQASIIREAIEDFRKRNLQDFKHQEFCLVS